MYLSGMSRCYVTVTGGVLLVRWSFVMFRTCTIIVEPPPKNKNKKHTSKVKIKKNAHTRLETHHVSSPCQRLSLLSGFSGRCHRYLKKDVPMDQTRRLGPFSSSHLLSTSRISYLSTLCTYIYNKTLVSIKKIRKNKKEDVPKAQTTLLLSSGPVLVIAAHPNPPRVSRAVNTYIEPKYHKLVQKTRIMAYMESKRRKTRRLDSFSSSPPTQTFVVLSIHI
jgi:hypothetical protein